MNRGRIGLGLSTVAHCSSFHRLELLTTNIEGCVPVSPKDLHAATVSLSTFFEDEVFDMVLSGIETSTVRFKHRLNFAIDDKP